MLRGFILTVHIILALVIVLLVLMQRGKGADAGAGFGSGASGTVFGARGTATLFSKLTAVFAALFFTTSLLLAYMGTRTPVEPTSVIERAAQAAARAHSVSRPAEAPPVGAPPAVAPPAVAPPTQTAPAQTPDVPQPPAPTTAPAQPPPDNK
jgi:preprotein translocase subunit SecG